MSRDRLPPVPGWQPTKVVFAGVDPASPQAQQLYGRFQGEINRFHFLARQSVQTSEQPGTGMHRRLSGGAGSMRYSFNSGQEIIHVRLEPGVIEKVTKQPSTPPIGPCWLAIDVIIDPKVYTASDYAEMVPNTAYSEYYHGKDELFRRWDTNTIITIAKRNGVFSSNNPSSLGSTSIKSALYNPSYMTDLETLPNILVANMRDVPFQPDGLSTGTFGASFVAKVDFSKGEIFDVYLASQNLIQTGTIQDFAKDLGPLSYSPEPSALAEVRYRLQVRQLPPSTPSFVFASSTLHALDTTTLYSEPVPPDPPEPLPTTEVDVPYLASWAFAVGSSWVDGGGEVMDPKAPGMGTLLARTEIATATVKAPDPLPVQTGTIYDGISGDLLREFPLSDPSPFPAALRPYAPMQPADMTAVATISWSPPNAADQPSIATIKPVV